MLVMYYIYIIIGRGGIIIVVAFIFIGPPSWVKERSRKEMIEMIFKKLKIKKMGGEK